MKIYLPGILLACTALIAGDRALPPPEDIARRVELAATAAAMRQVELPDSFVVLFSRFSGADPIVGAARLEPIEVQGPNESGFVRVTFGLVVDGVPRGQARATVRGRVRGPAVLTSRTLIGGEIIDSSDLVVEEVDLTRLTATPLRSVEQAAGRVPVRTLGRNRVLTDALVEPPPLVQRGQTVDLTIKRGRMMIRTRAKVLRNGAAGEVVPAENSVTGVRLQGRVQPDGTLMVVR